MNMKKMLSAGLVLLALCLGVSLLMTACDKGGDGTDTGTEPATDTEAATTPATEPETVTDAVTEPETEPETETETETEEETHKTMLYQLAPEKNSLMMCYVIKTPNDKIIVIDGGVDGEGKDKVPYLPSAIRAILGIGDTDYFEIDAWFLTHCHKDHMYEMSKMMRDYTPESNYKINNIYFDFPPYGTPEYTGTSDDLQIAQLRENMDKYAKVIGAEVPEGMGYYDVLNGAVVNEAAIKEGLEFNIDGVRIEVLQTWNVKDGYSNLNDQSMIFRFWVDGQSILFLGDAGPIAGKRLVDTYGDALKSDIVQMAHHGQSGVDKNCYAKINAQVHLWPTPIWVWENANKTYQTDTTRTWLYGETFLASDEYNIVAGQYKKYPQRIDRVAAWSKVLDYMTLELPYCPPVRETIFDVQNPGPDKDFEPVETAYVKEGLVHCYDGKLNTRKGHDNDAAVWEDLVSGYDVKIKVTDKTHFVDTGLYVNNEPTYFPDKVVEVFDGQEFTVEMLLGDLNSTGTLYNDILSSGNEHINLFRRNSENVLELKSLNNNRIKIPDALNIMQNALLTITYKQGEFARVYVNGVRMGELQAANGSLGIGDLYIGHPAADSCSETVFRSFRVYNRALTDEECAFNAQVDGVGQ